MNYKDHYKELTNEAEIPFAAVDTVQKGLRAKYGSGELDAYTFGIELEFFPDKSDYVSINYNEIYATLRQNPRVKTEYEAHVAEKRRELNKNWNGKVDDWNNEYGPVDLDTFDDVVAEPELDRYNSDEQFEEAYMQWWDLRQEVDKKYKRWHDYDFYDKLNDFVQMLDPEEYGLDIDNFINDNFDWHRIITETMDYIKYKMQQNVIKSGYASKNEWAVGPDGDYVEIRSKHLNQSEFHLVEKICKFVDAHGTSGRTSAHVHIGLPDDFDVFDLLAISTLVDEKAVKNTAGPGRSFEEYARFRDSLHDIILKIIVARHNINEQNSYFVSNETLYNSLAYINRNHGTNIRAMFDKQTIEFRYFDSRITDDPDLFINWIKYFLLLPKVAKSRNKIKLVGRESDLIAVRESGGVRFYTDKKAPTRNLPAADIKTSKPVYAGKYSTKQYNHLNESIIKKVNIEDLLPDKDNMETAVDSLYKGMYSPNKQPIEVYASDDKYVVADGHHRLLKAIIDGEASVVVKVLDYDKPMNRDGTIELDLYDGNYYGLDNKLENGWLIKRL